MPIETSETFDIKLPDTDASTIDGAALQQLHPPLKISNSIPTIDEDQHHQQHRLSEQEFLRYQEYLQQKEALKKEDEERLNNHMIATKSAPPGSGTKKKVKKNVSKVNKPPTRPQTLSVSATVTSEPKISNGKGKPMAYMKRKFDETKALSMHKFDEDEDEEEDDEPTVIDLTIKKKRHDIPIICRIANFWRLLLTIENGSDGNSYEMMVLEKTINIEKPDGTIDDKVLTIKFPKSVIENVFTALMQVEMSLIEGGKHLRPRVNEQNEIDFSNMTTNYKHRSYIISKIFTFDVQECHFYSKSKGTSGSYEGLTIKRLLPPNPKNKDPEKKDKYFSLTLPNRLVHPLKCAVGYILQRL